MTYINAPPPLFTQPSSAKSTIFSISFAAHLISNTIPIKTNANEMTGSHVVPIFEFFCNHIATTAESFSAAAIPAIKASSEKTPIIKPFFRPLKKPMANMMRQIISIDIITVYWLVIP